MPEINRFQAFIVNPFLPGQIFYFIVEIDLINLRGKRMGINIQFLEVRILYDRANIVYSFKFNSFLC